MTESVPQYSPQMLKFFLRVGAAYRCFSEPPPAERAATIKRYKADMRRAARVTHDELELAWLGRLLTARPRGRLWAVLKINPADHGVKLVDAGGQETVND